MASQEIYESSAILLQVRKPARLTSQKCHSWLVAESRRETRHQAAASLSFTHCIHAWETGWQDSEMDSTTIIQQNWGRYLQGLRKVSLGEAGPKDKRRCASHADSDVHSKISWINSSKNFLKKNYILSLSHSELSSHIYLPPSLQNNTGPQLLSESQCPDILINLEYKPKKKSLSIPYWWTIAHTSKHQSSHTELTAQITFDVIMREETGKSKNIYTKIQKATVYVR